MSTVWEVTAQSGAKLGRAVGRSSSYARQVSSTRRGRTEVETEHFSARAGLARGLN